MMKTYAKEYWDILIILDKEELLPSDYDITNPQVLSVEHISVYVAESHSQFEDGLKSKA